MTTQQTLKKRLSSWVVANPIPAVTLAGLLVYGSLRFAYGIFYGRLGFTPEEVGLGYAETIAGAISVIVFIAFLRIVGGFAGAVFAAIFRFVGDRARGRPASFFTELNKTAGAAVYRIGQMTGASLFVFAVLVSPSTFAIGRATDAVDGFQSAPWLFDFPFRAETAVVHFDDSAASGLADGTCVLYLGQSDGVLALYDPATGTSWRASTSTTVVETGGRLDDVEQVPDDCPSASGG